VAELTVISWRDIPAQVTAADGAASARAALTDRFQLAIDDAAMRAGLLGSDEYLAEWRRESRECGPDLQREVAEEAARLEAAFPADELRRLVESEGRRRAPESNHP
jgi:Virulence factor